MSRDVFKALRSVLLNKIYPINAALVRNDTKAAKLVFDLAAQIEADYGGIEFDPVTGNPLEQYRAISIAYRNFRPLFGLTEGTIRKYISELWTENSLHSYVNFEKG